MTSPADPWNPARYAQFHDERAQPFLDLLALLQPTPGEGRALDLGCGTGELTRLLHERLGVRETIGVDASAQMLAASAKVAGGGLRFELGDLARLDAGIFAVIASNAALQWVGDHPALFARLAGQLEPGGQLAVQMPANHDFPTHTLAAEVARESPFREALGGYVRESPVLAPEAYAALLDALGFTAQSVSLRVYAHHLPSRESAIDWVRGTLLTDYEKRMPPALFSRFVERYRERLLPALSPAEPFFYPFKRLLIWGRRGSENLAR